MVGDQDDMVARLRAVLPPRWFPDVAPVLSGLLSGLANTAASTFSLVRYAQRQARIATAEDGWLDLVTQDCFGGLLTRQIGETDTHLRARVRRELLRERATRPALLAQIVDVTGNVPIVFEPARPADTGGWGAACSYGLAGGWGSLTLPFQCLVTARRASGGGIPALSGYGQGAGGYGVGSLAYVSPAQVLASSGDGDLLSAIASVMPAGAIAWTRIIS